MSENSLKVIIVILTYNLEKYISEALESILNQKTTYKYKILIGDDCSTDDTQKILKEYKEKYPEIIELRFSDKNLGCLGNSNRLFDGLQCEYFSLLDGDDVWLDEYHLQKQIDFLENNKDYTAVAANSQFIRNGKIAELMMKQDEVGKSYSFEDILENKCPYYHPSTTMFRNIIYKNGLPECYKNVVDTFENCALRGDDFRRLQHLEKGKVYIMPEVLSYYRIHENGIWQGTSEAKRKIEGAIEYNFFRKYYYNTPYFNYFNKSFSSFYRNMMEYLVFNCDIINGYSLNEKLTNLLTALLQDISKNDIPFEIDNKIQVYKKQQKVSLLKRIFRKIKKIVIR